MTVRIGCVLAGGRSSRMGRDKATLQVHGRPLIDRALEQLRTAGCQPVIAGPRPDLETYAPVLPDLHPGCGPLSGIEAALTAASFPAAALAATPSSSAVLFLPIDLPLLPAAFLALLLERAERTGALATIPVLGGRPQPLCAVYRTELLPGITSALEQGDYKVMRVIEATTPPGKRDLFGVEAVLSARADLLNRKPEPLYRWFANINTPQALAALSLASPLPQR
jgi:molybdopterin-guanine dinucleotide biosynthesis protein A